MFPIYFTIHSADESYMRKNYRKHCMLSIKSLIYCMHCMFSESASETDVLTLLRMTGNMLNIKRPEQRQALTQEMWDSIQQKSTFLSL